MNNDKGFTLVEVIAAMAVVAIVSTSIFQMFVTSTYLNKDAQVMDVANIVTVQLAETFKSDPTPYDDVLNPGGYDPRTRYYNGKSESLTEPSPGVIPTGAVIKVVSTWTLNNAPANNSSYYPDFAATLDLALFTDCDLEITNGYEIGVQAHVGSGLLTSLYNQGTLKIKNSILPLRVNFPSGGTSKTIYLTNNSDVEVELYVFNANSSDVSLDTVQGASSIVYIPVTSSSNTEYALTLIVSRLNKGVSEEMFRYSANKFLYTN